MNKEDLLSSQLKEFYDKISHSLVKGNCEFMLNELFDIDDILNQTSTIMENNIKDHFILEKSEDDIEKVKLMIYDDYYDFLNTITKIDVDELLVFFSEEDLQRYVLSVISLLNDAFNKWVQNSKLFRKKSKIYIDFFNTKEKGKDKEIVIFFDPEVKF